MVKAFAGFCCGDAAACVVSTVSVNRITTLSILWCCASLSFFCVLVEGTGVYEWPVYGYRGRVSAGCYVGSKLEERFFYLSF